jgi:hypothetical protein
MHKIYDMALKYTKILHFNIYQKWDFWYANTYTTIWQLVNRHTKISVPGRGRRGMVVITSTLRPEDRGFESLRGVKVLASYTLQNCCLKLEIQSFCVYLPEETKCKNEMKKFWQTHPTEAKRFFTLYLRNKFQP